MVENHELMSLRRRKLFTILFMSANVFPAQLMIIFPRKNENNNLGDCFLSDFFNRIFTIHMDYWITTQLLIKLFRYFVQEVHASEQNPAILVFNGHFMYL